MGAGACGPVVWKSRATVTPDELPSDEKALIEQAEAWYRTADPVALENAVVALDKAMRLVDNPFEPAWRAARDAFLLADAATDSDVRREHFASVGANYARAAEVGNPARVEGHYYLALNLGYQASTKTVAALDILPEIVKAGKKAADIDEKYDHAGPHRLLGMLYLRAPAWPTSIGDVDEALEHLRRAVELAPDYPPNHTFLAQALIVDEKKDEAKKQVEEALALPPPKDVTWKLSAPAFEKEAHELAKKLGVQ